jgi:hypothetical protein
MGSHPVRLATVALLCSALLAGSPTAPAAAATPIPAHVFAPYFMTWTTESLTTLAQQSGARYFTLAFLETLGKHSCTLAWNGSKSQTSTRVATSPTSRRCAGWEVT